MFENEILCIGTCRKTHGVDGELLISLNSKVSDNIKDLKAIFLIIDGGSVPFCVEKIRGLSNNSFIVKIKDYNTIDEAKELTHSDIYIHVKDSEFIKEKKAAAGNDIDDFLVIDRNKGEIGTVIETVSLKNNPLLKIKNKNKEILIPINSDIVESVDFTEKRVYINAPEGLIDMYMGL